jgi:two-component system LytT family response regulator|tara:strand:+ start:4983 stop:5753 length:771 start_codon:yes stop_codon:yes gene_type:complete
MKQEMNPTEYLTAIILDDEKSACQLLNSMVDQYCPNIEVLLVTQDPMEALEKIENLDPDILFIDINMPKMSGFEFIDTMKGFNGKIIFTTAYDNYAIQAFKYAAFDYLLKPIHVERLENTVQRLSKQTTQKDDSSSINQLLAALNQEKTKSSEVLAVHNNGDLQFLNKNDIHYFEASSNYTLICCEKEKHVSSKTLKEFENLLDESAFIRVHKSFIVNVKFIERYSPKDSGYLILKSGIKIPFSRRKRHLLNQFSI